MSHFHGQALSYVLQGDVTSIMRWHLGVAESVSDARSIFARVTPGRLVGHQDIPIC